MKQFFIVLVTLALVHSAVSFGAYRLLTKTSVGSSTEGPPVETTTPEERASGRASFTWTHTEVVIVTKYRPTAVVFYMWSGYIGLVAAVLYAFYFRFRYGQ